LHPSTSFSPILSISLASRLISVLFPTVCSRPSHPPCWTASFFLMWASSGRVGGGQIYAPISLLHSTPRIFFPRRAWVDCRPCAASPFSPSLLPSPIKVCRYCICFYGKRRPIPILLSHSMGVVSLALIDANFSVFKGSLPDEALLTRLFPIRQKFFLQSKEMWIVNLLYTRLPLPFSEFVTLLAASRI